MEIVIASQNLHKIREIKRILSQFKNLDCVSLIQFPKYTPPVTEGKTFKENAIEKALKASSELNRWVIADASGLVVPGLKGAPGVQGQTYAGIDATDAENRTKLLKDMESVQDPERSAYFECSLALASPQKLYKTVTGYCEGSLLTEERGRNGFGYDALFVKSEYDKSFAEIDEITKNRISHRRKALEKLFPTLEKLCATSLMAIT